MLRKNNEESTKYLEMMELDVFKNHTGAIFQGLAIFGKRM